MKLFFYPLLFVLLASCTNPEPKLSLLGPADFRKSFASIPRDTAAEDSVLLAKPTWVEDSDSSAYKYLSRNGLVVNNQLDTSVVQWYPLNEDFVNREISGLTFTYEMQSKEGRQYLHILKGRRKIKIGLGSIFVTRSISVNDFNSDDVLEIMLLGEYYIMLGYNFDIRIYQL